MESDNWKDYFGIKDSLKWVQEFLIFFDWPASSWEGCEWLNISTSKVNEDLQNVGNECYKFEILGKEKELNLLLILMCPCCCLKKICPASFHETCQQLIFPLNGLRAQSRISPTVGLLPLASGPACLEMAFTPFLVKQLHCCVSVVISPLARTGYTTIRWGWLLGRIVYSITHHYPLYPMSTTCK